MSRAYEPAGMLLCVTPGLRGKGCVSWWVLEKGGCSVPSPELLWAALKQQRFWDRLLSPWHGCRS